MGSSVGAAARARGASVLWCATGRSAATRKRAEAAGLEAVATLGDLTRASDIVISLCPPHAALDVAHAVAASDFRGVFVDANAVSRATMLAIAEIVERAGASCVDGSVLGPPAAAGRTTLLCLSGPRAPEVAEVFAGSVLEPQLLGPLVGQASALKMAFAAWSKGSSALLLAVRALAVAEGVDTALLAAWQRFSPELAQKSESAATGSAPKAWRWEAEMREIAASFEAAGLPRGFHDGAAELYARLARFENEAVSFDAVLSALLKR
jgi:3-hydroxyisobutyrate dehydrogenase-like beta-hydroxyacid dehydrogenase